MQVGRSKFRSRKSDSVYNQTVSWVNFRSSLAQSSKHDNWLYIYDWIGGLGVSSVACNARNYEISEQ